MLGVKRVGIGLQPSADATIASCCKSLALIVVSRRVDFVQPSS